jgi:isocitrate dehydrogenase
VYDFKGKGGVDFAMYNTDEGITEFTLSCFKFTLQRGYSLYFASKNTILKKYGGRFEDILINCTRRNISLSLKLRSSGMNTE